MQDQTRIPVITKVARDDMLEKLGWMQRSFARMKTDLDSAEDVQDHFLSFLHASHLLYFYFARWAKNIQRPENPSLLIVKYISGLSATDAGIWNCLHELRTEDVHTQPIRISNPERPGALCVDGQEFLVDGYPILIGDYRYVVQHSGSSHDLLKLCASCLVVKAKFCRDFDEIV